MSGEYFTPDDEKPENVIEDAKNENQMAMFEDGYQSEWKGMPEWKHDFEEPHTEVTVRFRNQEDYEAFAALIGQTLTLKTKSIWHPKREIDPKMAQRYVDEES